MLSSGGMPSSHSATVTALALSIGLEEGAGAPAFAISLVLACVVSSLSISLLSLHFSLNIQSIILLNPKPSFTSLYLWYVWVAGNV